MDGASDFGIGPWPAILLAVGWAYLLVLVEVQKHNGGNPLFRPESGTSKAIAELCSLTHRTSATLTNQPFDEALFLERAEAAYETILTLYAAGDMEKLAELLEPEVLEVFSAETARRASTGETMTLEFVALDRSEIVNKEFGETSSSIQVRFESELFLSEGRKPVEEGLATPTLTRAVDIWAFSREHSSTSPVWRLAATDSQ